jgi:IS4 transposase
MQHQNSVFQNLLKHIPFGVFDRLVASHNTDKYTRKLSTKSQFIAMLYGQLSGSVSLREIEDGLQSHRSKLYHLGAKPISRSTLADANLSRTHAVFSGLLNHMMGQVSRKLKSQTKQLLRLIDSTSLPLSGIASEWAKFSKDSTKAKAHIIYDPDFDRPVYLSITPGNVNDITAAQDMPIEDNATYVFDKGYFYYTWWAKMHEKGCRFVTRPNARLNPTFIEERAIPADSDIVSDRLVSLPKRDGKRQKNPFKWPVRIIEMIRQGEKNIQFITNDLTSPAQDIADLYKRRWAIELFFKWVKQVLKIKHFLGRSENAVRIQIAVALIAYIALRLAQTAVKTPKSILAYTRLVRANLMHKKTLDKLLQSPQIIPLNKRQMHLNLGET